MHLLGNTVRLAEGRAQVSIPDGPFFGSIKGIAEMRGNLAEGDYGAFQVKTVFPQRLRGRRRRSLSQSRCRKEVIRFIIARANKLGKDTFV
jgi:hypothetical protein